VGASAGVRGCGRLPRCPRAGRQPRGFRYLAAAATVVATVVLAFPGIAGAHAFLVQSSPEAGQRLSSGPRSPELQFTEPVVAATQDRVTVRTAAGQRVAGGALARSADGTILTAGLPALGQGVYLVDWQVVSTQDGHYSSGEFAFAVGTGVTLPAVSSEAAAVAWPEAVASWLVLAGLAFGAGGLLDEQFVWGPLRAAGASPPPLPLTGSVLVAALGTSGLFLLYARALTRGRRAWPRGCGVVGRSPFPGRGARPRERRTHPLPRRH